MPIRNVTSIEKPWVEDTQQVKKRTTCINQNFIMILTPRPARLVVYTVWHGEFEPAVRDSHLLHLDQQIPYFRQTMKPVQELTLKHQYSLIKILAKLSSCSVVTFHHTKLMACYQDRIIPLIPTPTRNESFRPQLLLTPKLSRLFCSQGSKFQLSIYQRAGS